MRLLCRCGLLRVMLWCGGFLVVMVECVVLAFLRCCGLWCVGCCCVSCVGVYSFVSLVGVLLRVVSRCLRLFLCVLCVGQYRLGVAVLL